jgi:steroid delta-isomerase-like uncharacterized protein
MATTKSGKSEQSGDTTAVATELVEAFNIGNWERLRATLHPDVLYEETGTGRRVTGADDYVRLCQGWKESLPDARGTVQTTIASGPRVAQEILWEGTHDGPLAGPGGVMPPSGKRIRVRGTLWYTMAGGRAREIHHHLDVLSLLQQIGAMPAAAPTH